LEKTPPKVIDHEAKVVEMRRDARIELSILRTIERTVKRRGIPGR